jgi:predicted NUDIX family NTP pyrophosphohydrolase
MDLSKKANLIIYRLREKGLEIFLINSDEQGESWEIPQGTLLDEHSQSLLEAERLIELDPVEEENGRVEQAWAVEGDWHEIPSLKSMLYEDAKYLKGKLKELEKGGFFAVKEALKKVMPHQYQFLKELKDIITDRNSVKDI